MSIKLNLRDGVLLAVCLLPRMSIGQQLPASITIGGLKLSLGMEEKEVVSKLSTGYSVELFYIGNWIVCYKNSQPCRQVASLFFKSGKLSKVFKQWTRPNDDAYDSSSQFAKALYGAVAGFVAEGRKSCAIDAGLAPPQPGGESRSVFIMCGEKSLTITILQTAGGELATISEDLEEQR